MLRAICCLLVGLALSTALAQEKKTREQKVREDRTKVEAEGAWIYNDLPQAFNTAKENGKPILVVLRCIPCEECVKLDDDLVDQDPVIRPLLEKFVRVRQVSTNGLDLNLFQYDTDQSFAVFLLNADGTIYGRFGTRSHRTDWLEDVSLPGLAKALQGAIELHADYPANKNSLTGKRGKPLEFASPEQYPQLKGRYTDRLNYEGNVVASCIHCHQIGDARRDFYRQANKPIPEELLFSYPHPKVIGLILDPEEKATVKDVTRGSPAEAAGFQAGDDIESLDQQPLLSMADVQWVLHNVPASGGDVAAQVQRAGKAVRLTLKLAEGWRKQDDLSWRASSWGLRRMATGGLKLDAPTQEERQTWQIPDGKMALVVKHVGQYGPHAAAKQAGFQVGDVLIEVAGQDDLLRETDVLRYGVTQGRGGEKFTATVLRGGVKKELMLPLQK